MENQINFKNFNIKSWISFENQLNILKSKCAICFRNKKYNLNLDYRFKNYIFKFNKDLNNNLGWLLKKLERELLLKPGTAYFKYLLPQNIYLSKENIKYNKDYKYP